MSMEPGLLIAQAVGLLGLLFMAISFQKDRKSFTLLFQLLGALAFMGHFVLLNAWTGAAMCGLSAARAYVFNLRDTVRWIDSIWVMVLFVALFWIAGALTWQGYISVLPVAGMTLECFALWDTRTTRIRWLYLSARPAWIAYDFLVGSYAGLATEAFIVSSITIAIIRFDVLKKSERDEGVGGTIQK